MQCMASRDIFEAVGAITCPLPDADAFAAANQHLSDADRDDVFDDVRTAAAREREVYINDLREEAERAAERDEEFDPLLAEVARCRAEMLAAERRMRLLVAYAREYVRPQPYQLKDLAQAAGLSISGVRIAYDEDEVREVGELTGDKPRRPWTDASR
jgi:hypothetical protein